MDEIIRYTEQPVEGFVLERGENNSRRIRGLASVYYNGDKSTEFQLGKNIVERIARGAFDNCLDNDVVLAVDHSGAVARTPKTLTLSTTARGLEYVGELGNKSAANDLWDDLQRGVIKGSSFKAIVNMQDKNCVNWSKEGDTDVLTIKRFERLKDVSAVLKPAYSGTECQAVSRSLAEHKAIEETLIRIALYEKLKAEVIDKLQS